MDIATFLPVATEHFQYPLKTAQKLSNTNHWGFVSGFPKPFLQCPAAVQLPLREFSNGYLQKRSHFFPCSLKQRVYNSLYNKLKAHREIL
jgi:hypothetical protein